MRREGRRRRRRSAMGAQAHYPPSALLWQPAITLVSLRWHRVFYSEPEFWRSLELTAASVNKADGEGQAQQWFAAKALLLHRIGGFVQRLLYSHVVEKKTSEGEDDCVMLDIQQLAAGSTRVECGTTAEPLPQLSTVFAPTRLRSLTWEEARQDGMLLLDVRLLSACLPQLDSWHIDSFWSEDDEDDKGTLLVRCAARDGWHDVQLILPCDVCLP